jgi:hypothetical protein
MRIDKTYPRLLKERFSFSFSVCRTIGIRVTPYRLSSTGLNLLQGCEYLHLMEEIIDVRDRIYLQVDRVIVGKGLRFQTRTCYSDPSPNRRFANSQQVGDKV